MNGQSQRIKSILEIYDVNHNERQVVYVEEDHFEAPNWSRDGTYLIINQDGLLYRLDLKSKKKTLIPTDFADHCNNDHGISPDGTMLVISHHDDPDRNWLKSRIYTLPIGGGTPKVVTDQVPSFWHGWSPNGKTLAYVGRRNDDFNIYAISVNGGPERQLTSEAGLDDGPDYSPDGRHIYYNSMSSGKMEIWRMKADGSDKKQLTDDSYSNWFPHPSPDGQHLVYIAYKQDQGSAHPPMKDVALRLMDLESNKIRTLCSFTGGQGTINVPSWSPDGTRFAFVSYEWME